MVRWDHGIGSGAMPRAGGGAITSVQPVVFRCAHTLFTPGPGHHPEEVPTSLSGKAEVVPVNNQSHPDTLPGGQGSHDTDPQERRDQPRHRAGTVWSPPLRWM